jgi:hypothetical protein
VYAHEVYAHEVHAYEVHAYEVHAREMHAREMHARTLFGEEVAAAFPCGASSRWLVKWQIDCAGRPIEKLKGSGPKERRSTKGSYALRSWMGQGVPGLDFGEAALQGDHEFSSNEFFT